MPTKFRVPIHKIQNVLEDDIQLAIQVRMEELVKLDENCWHVRENMNHIQLLQKYQQDDKGKIRSFKKGELVLWMPKATKIKCGKFRLMWKGPYKVQIFFNNNTIKLSTLSNDDMEKLNINKLKEYQHNDTPILIMTNVVTIQKKSKLRWDSYRNGNRNAKLLWTNNDYTDEIKWLPSGEPKFKEKMSRKCKINSKKRRYNKSRTIEQLYSHKYVPTTTIAISV
jgi:hypothetical protein